MRLDRFAKGAAPTSPRARRMGALSKLGLMLRSKRLIYGAVVTLFVLWLADENIRKPGVAPRCWFSMAGATAEARGAVSQVEFVAGGKRGIHRFRVWYTYDVGGTTYRSMGFYTGPRFREGEALDVTYATREPSCSCAVEGCPAQEAMFTLMIGGPVLLIALLVVRSGARRMERMIAVIEFGAVTTAAVRSISNRKVIARYQDPAGHKHSLEVTALIDVVYDPGQPENAVAIDALPRFVRTDPALRG
jgi:hypothetical protein